jgi:hypothetical protein
MILVLIRSIGIYTNITADLWNRGKATVSTLLTCPKAWPLTTSSPQTLEATFLNEFMVESRFLFRVIEKGMRRWKAVIFQPILKTKGRILTEFTMLFSFCGVYKISRADESQLF